ncbi:DUF4179 domain-containing protein [Brevibacillus ginsengisoli]|uniref:DUF4179 domain-containing protein n=1 Tax=Brevibacillus ginsengisoli TaxID=363854 RepID=UPI003CF19DBF
MNQWDHQYQKDIEKALDRIEVPKSLFAFAKQLPYQTVQKSLATADQDEGQIISPTRRNKFMKLKYAAIATVATIALSVSIGAAVSPTFADYLKSLFDRPTLDQGLQAAAKQGFSQVTDSAITDQGITLRVKEVLADSNRLIFTYSLDDEKGKAIDPTSLFDIERWGKEDMYFKKARDAYYITDDSDKVVSTSINYRTISGKDVTQSFKEVILHPPYADLTFRLQEDLHPKKLFLHIDLHEINSVKGNWKLTVPVDLEKSLASTKKLPIDQDYTTSDGLHIQLQYVVYSPTATSFDILSEWTQEGKDKMKNHPEFFMFDEKYYSYHMLRYQIVNERGEVVATTFPTNEEDQKLLPVSSRTEEDHDKGAKMVWHQSFAPFNKGEKLFFELKGVQRTEYPHEKLTIHPRTLKEKPVTMEYKGNHYTFTNFTVDSKNNWATLEVEQVVTEMGGDFSITDPQGKVYRPDNLASKGEWIKLDRKDGKFKVKSKLVYKDFTVIPDELPVSLDIASVLYDHVKWKTSIPQP